MPRRLWVVGLSSLLATACGNDSWLGPTLPLCTASSDSLKLALAGDTAIDPGPNLGCIAFGANLSGSPIQYLIVPQSANGVPTRAPSFLLRSTTVPPAAPVGVTLAAAPSVPTQQQFDWRLRRVERDLALRMGPPPPPPARAALAPSAPQAPPVPGDVRAFKVCGDTLCLAGSMVTVKATAKTVGGHVAIYVDSADITRGDTLGTVDLRAFAAVFDTLLYPTDTAAFGRESDIDHNGVVIVLMTGRINALAGTSGCTGAYIGGYFFGGDLLAGYKGGNNAEIFYSIVPDPLSKVSCVSHSASEVKKTIPATFIHEFQHMISFNQHYLLRGGSPEELWLNEGLSHYAEELGGRQFLPGDSATYCYFLFGDLSNSFTYFADPQSAFLVDTSTIGSLASRGAFWLFVRFLVDQFASDTSTAAAAVLTSRLDSTTLTGVANVANAVGVSFATIAERWVLANYVSDLPGFTPGTELRYRKWQFRSDYPTTSARCSVLTGVANFPNVYPLFPTTGVGNSTNLVGTLPTGSGTYYIAQQAASDPGFTLLFSDGSGRALRPSHVPRLNVIRIQ